jgi:hypothetical protein
MGAPLKKFAILTINQSGGKAAWNWCVKSLAER